MKNLLNNKYLSLLAAALVIIILVWILRQGSSSASGGARVTAVLRQDLTQRVTIAGVLEPVRTTILAPPYDGYIKKIYVHLGETAKANEPLVSLAQSLHGSENVFPIRSPFTGTVTQILKTEGQFAKQADKDYILRLDDMSKMYVNASAPEIDIVKIKSQLEVVIKVSAVLERAYKGVVREIAQAATVKDQWGSRSQVEYAVKVEILDKDEQIKPGMTAVLDIITNKKENVLTLPQEFIQRENDHYFVMSTEGTRKEIQIGLQNDSLAEITAGLQEGEKIQQIDFLKLVEQTK